MRSSRSRQGFQVKLTMVAAVASSETAYSLVNLKIPLPVASGGALGYASAKRFCRRLFSGAVVA